MTQVNLDQREKIGFACGIFALTLVVMLGIYLGLGGGKGTYNNYERSRKAVEAKRTELEVAHMDLHNEKVRIASQAELKERLETRDAGFDLYSFMNRTLGECGLQSRASLDNYVGLIRRAGDENRPAVKLTLQSVSLEELVSFLHKVYVAKNLIVMQQFELAPNAKSDGLHCEVTFLTVKA